MSCCVHIYSLCAQRSKGEVYVMKSFAEAKAIVQVVLPYGWVDRINQLALERGLNRSALIREAIARTYFGQRADGEKGGEPAETIPIHQARE